jgi:hypothetical protein
MLPRRALLSLAVLSVVMRTTSAAATELLPGSDLPGDAPVEEPAPEELPVPVVPAVVKPAPYSLPWHLRPAVAVSAVRSDTVIAFQDLSRTVVSFMSASWKIVPDVAVSARYGWVQDAPKAEPSRSAFTNVGLAGLYAPKLSSAFRLALSGGVVLPVAQGGGGAPDPGDQKAIASGSYARSAMDNAMFAANDLSLFGGLALAYIADGWTVQLETTFFYLMRVKGDAVQRDATKTNTTWAAHVGYYVIPELSIGGELRYQDFLAPPKAIKSAPERRDTSTAAIGLRAHYKLGDHAIHPGVSYAHPLDDPMAKAGYRIVQIDVPFVF